MPLSSAPLISGGSVQPRPLFPAGGLIPICPSHRPQRPQWLLSSSGSGHLKVRHRRPCSRAPVSPARLPLDIASPRVLRPPPRRQFLPASGGARLPPCLRLAGRVNLVHKVRQPGGGSRLRDDSRPAGTSPAFTVRCGSRVSPSVSLTDGSVAVTTTPLRPRQPP